MNVRSYIRVFDPGHSWLRVPYKDLINSGVENKITQYSYRTKDYAFLEEDCDLVTFYNAMVSDGTSIHIDEIHVDDFDEYLRRNFNAVFSF